jgi:hypothetical protein
MPVSDARPPWLARASCAVWGHHVDNHLFERASSRHCGHPFCFADPRT